jgi:glutaredoxin-dependent peroxiredoxin
MIKISVGQQAPAFTMFTSERKEITLESFRGQQVLLLFFPAAFTSTCTKELCSVRDDLSFYNDANAVVIGISTDSLYTLAKYKEEQQLNFLMAADYNKEVCRDYGAQYEVFNYNMKGTAKRAAFVIDTSGIIRYAEVLEKAGDIPDFNRIKAALG